MTVDIELEDESDWDREFDANKIDGMNQSGTFFNIYPLVNTR